jgi:peptidoglycan/LPS O-acetylase OafA/YrhL
MAAHSQPVALDRDLSAPEPLPLRILSPAINSASRIPALDGLRGIAILLVLLFHAIFQLQPATPWIKQWLAAGRLAWSGVDLFFVLSGFLIGGILLDERSSPRYFATFYIRRAFRILPLYYLALALFSLRFLPLQQVFGHAFKLSPNPVPWISYLTFTQNIAMALVGGLGAVPMAATWSLAVEEQFYLTIPWIIRKIARPNLAWILVSVIVLAPLLRTALYLFFRHGGFAAYVLMPCRADALCLGVFCALLVRTPRWSKLLLAHRKSLYVATGFLFLGLVALTFRGYEFSAWMLTIGYSWLGLFYSGCLLIAITARSGIAQCILCNRLLMRLGVLAYCIYLLHLPLIEASRRLLGLHWNYASTAIQLIGGLAGIVLTIAIAGVSWNLLEKPLLRRGHAYKY